MSRMSGGGDGMEGEQKNWVRVSERVHVNVLFELMRQYTRASVGEGILNIHGGTGEKRSCLF